ncbi:MAG TPA: nucleotide exchange factor GrpE [Vicinamibacterales bacterium]|nr:nucleotide exchange factor GrpE [Acidobacteriota bacterium]HOC16886.1 nucleotide exchange factor GrpE [Vicinamibacterales bacterium]
MEQRDDTAARPLEEAAPAEERVESGAAAEPDLAALERERDEYRDLLLRKSAEFDNYRKRVERERRELVQYAASEVFEGLLPILDDFERALQAPAGGSAEAYRQGIELIHKQLVDFLAKRGVKPIEALGSSFDPRFHEAITYEERPGSRDGEVVEEIRRGYVHGDRLLRPAVVRVAKA